MYSPSSKQTAVFFASVASRQFFNCCFVLICVFAGVPCAGLSQTRMIHWMPSMDWMDEQCLHVLTSTNWKLVTLNFLKFISYCLHPNMFLSSSYCHFLTYVVVLVNLFHLKHSRRTDSLRGRRKKMKGREGRRGGKSEKGKRERKGCFPSLPNPLSLSVLSPLPPFRRLSRRLATENMFDNTLLNIWTEGKNTLFSWWCLIQSNLH